MRFSLCVLATLLFHVKNASAGNTTLNLSDVLLVDSLLLPIPSVEEDAVVNIIDAATVGLNWGRTA